MKKKQSKSKNSIIEIHIHIHKDTAPITPSIQPYHEPFTPNTGDPLPNPNITIF